MNKYEKGIKKFTVLLVIGGVVYSLIELVWRGRTHPSMGLAGGLCLCGLYGIRTKCTRLGVIASAGIGCIVITAVEFIFGCVCNRMLELDVWDYSNLYCNLLGQICLVYTFLWFLLCFPAFGLCRLCKKHIFDRW